MAYWNEAVDATEAALTLYESTLPEERGGFLDSALDYLTKLRNHNNDERLEASKHNDLNAGASMLFPGLPSASTIAEVLTLTGREFPDETKVLKTDASTVLRNRFQSSQQPFTSRG
jgi:hypothetical protein